MSQKASSERPTSLLIQPIFVATTPIQRSIKAFNLRRIRSRSQRDHSKQIQISKPKLRTSQLGDMFEAADQVFRNSLAFKHPSQLTLPPRKREINQMWRASLMSEQFEQAKSEQIRKNMYASNYRLPFRHSQWYRGRPL